eukprot:10808891-Alexandrium_andersonii.AAC.1
MRSVRFAAVRNLYASISVIFPRGDHAQQVATPWHSAPASSWEQPTYAPASVGASESSHGSP